MNEINTEKESTERMPKSEIMPGPAKPYLKWGKHGRIWGNHRAHAIRAI